ncbi:hypothetical protein, partial [Soonwooa sp.]|uniref:hypothetical protein n=1 Tax=Soonwooa sp. TaxID=1938592 RepID=UPI00289FEA4C
SLVFLQSNNVAGATIYKNGTAVTGTVMPSVAIGGIATNNVPGAYFGNVYGFQSNTKTLYPIYPSGTAIPITSTDTDWNNGTTFGTDTFFDYQNNIYTFINNGSSRYLFKISIATGVAEKAISAPISGSASFANLPTASGIQGMAYLQGYVYIATSVNGAGTIVIRRINMFDGVSTTVATYTVSSFSNLDLASVPYYVPFTLTCNGISQSSTTIPFVERVPSNGVRSLNIPITNVYGPGTYTINIIGANFNSSSTVNITSSTTSINVPLVYDGGGSSGTRTLSVNLNGSSTACSVNVVVEKDTDKDTIPDYQDLDSDNDGILDTAELYCDTTTASNVTYPATNSPAAAPLFAKQLLFFDWSGVTLSPTSPSATKSVVYNGVTYTATISNYTSVGTGTPNAMVGNDILTWSGPSQMVGRYYNVNSTTFKEALYIPSTGFTGVNSFNISVTASKDGVAYPVDFVFFDAETTNKSAIQTEQIKFTNNTAGTIELLEKTGTGTIGATTDGVVNITGIGTNTVTLNETETSNVNALLFVKGYSPSVKVDITTSLGSQQGVGFAVRLYCDTDNDGTPSYLDTDSDADGCPDALEGSEFVRRTHIHSLSLPTTDANYPYRGQIKVTYNGTTTGTPAQIISTSTGANGVPQLVNVAGSNLNTTTNPSNLAGISDNTDGTADIGQNFGSSQDSLVRDPDCDRCFRPATTAGTTLPTNHGITALARAGGNTGEWPVRVNGAYTVLDAKTKGFVINRVPTSALTSITGVTGMMVYDTTVNCLKIYDGTSWNCYTKQTCNDSNP